MSTWKTNVKSISIEPVKGQRRYRIKSVIRLSNSETIERFSRLIVVNGKEYWVADYASIPREIKDVKKVGFQVIERETKSEEGYTSTNTYPATFIET